MPRTRSDEPTIISFYSHKGGVGKTTEIHNTAYILSEILHYRVLLIDADPQCSLTGLVMHETVGGQKDIYEYLDKNKDTYTNIYDSFSFLTEKTDKNRDKHKSPKEIIEERARSINKKLYYPSYSQKIKADDPNSKERRLAFLPGHRDFHKFNREATFAYKENMGRYEDVKTIFRELFVEITKKNKKSVFDFILIDLNPGATRINQILLMSGDYFVIPVMPDHFSKLSLTTLAEIFKNWIADQQKNISFEPSVQLPKFLGVVAQRVFLRNNLPVVADQKWLDLIYEQEGKFMDTLKPHGMVSEHFKQFKISVKAFSSKGLTAQNKSKPIMALKMDANEKTIKNQFKQGLYNFLYNMSKEDKRDRQFYSEIELQKLDLTHDKSSLSRAKFIQKNIQALQNREVNFKWDFSSIHFPFPARTDVLHGYFISKADKTAFTLAAAEQAIYLIENDFKLKCERKLVKEFKDLIDSLFDILNTYLSDISDDTQTNNDVLATSLDSIVAKEKLDYKDIEDFLALTDAETNRRYQHYYDLLYVITHFKHFHRKDKKLIEKKQAEYANAKNDFIDRMKRNKNNKYEKFITEIFSENTQGGTLPFILEAETPTMVLLLLKNLNVILHIENTNTGETVQLNDAGNKHLALLQQGLAFSFSNLATTTNEDTLKNENDCSRLLARFFTQKMIKNLKENSSLMKDNQAFQQSRWQKPLSDNDDRLDPNKPVTIIASFNHKGGVGKTTTTYHLAQKYSKSGKRVLMVDADPQCNLSSIFMQRDFELFSSTRKEYNNHFNFYSLLYFLFFNDQITNNQIIENSEIYQSPLYDNLFLMPARFDATSSTVEIQIAELIAAAASSPGLRATHQLNQLLKGIAKKFAIDVIFLDLSPSISYVNELMLMNSDYFIVPFIPDYQSQQSLISLARLLPDWFNDMKKICEQINEQDKLLPQLPGLNQSQQSTELVILQPKLLHIIPQRYALGKKKPDTFEFQIEKTAQDKINEIYETAKTYLLPKLQAINMWHKNHSDLTQLSGIPNFNSRGIIAQMTGHTVMDVPLKNLNSRPGKKRNDVDEAFYNNLFQQIIDAIDSSIQLYETPEKDKMDATPINPGLAIGIFSKPPQKRKESFEELESKRQKQRDDDSESSNEFVRPKPDPKIAQMNNDELQAFTKIFLGSQ